MSNICVYCGSGSGKDSVYRENAAALGRIIAQRRDTLVYGGAGVGLMKTIADEVLKHGGKVIGIIPEHIKNLEIAHTGITELRTVNNMQERKMQLIEISDAFIAMPGGFGTLDELFETLVLSQLNLVNKPAGLFNINGYFDKLMEFIRHMTGEGFLRKEHYEMLIVENDPEKLLDKLNVTSSLSVQKWVDEIKEQEKL